MKVDYNYIFWVKHLSTLGLAVKKFDKWYNSMAIVTESAFSSKVVGQARKKTNWYDESTY